MSVLSRAVDLVTFRDLPANQAPVRRYQPAIETRSAISSLSGSIPGWSSGKPTWPTDTTLVMTRDGYRKCVTAFACINVIADAVAESTLRVWLDEGSGKRDEQVDHPLRQLMQRPHPQRSESEWLALTIRIAAITGYCVVEKVRARAGNVVQLGHLRFDYLKPILRDHRPPDWEYTIPGSPPAVLAAEDAVVFTYLDSPFLDVTGDTPMRAILREAGILNDLTDFVKLLLERGGMPQVVLVAEPVAPDAIPVQLTSEEIDAIREQFRQKYAGYRNWVGPAVLDGYKVQTVGLNLNEMAFKDLRDGIDLEVCRAFRVPPPVVQVMAGLTTSYGQTLEQSMKLLQLYTANPLRARLDGTLTRALLPEFDVRTNVSLEFDTSQVDALQEDEDAVHTRAREDLRAGGLTLDQFRQRIGEEPLNTEIGRALLLPFSVVPTPIDLPVVPVKPTTTDPPDEPDDGDDQRFIKRDGRRYLNERSLTIEERTQQDAAVSMARLHIARLADLVAPKVDSFLDEQRERVLDAVVGSERADQRTVRLDSMLNGIADPEKRRNVAFAMATRALDQIDWASEDDLLQRIMRAWWESVGETAFESASGQLGTVVDWSLSNPYLGGVINVLGKRVSDLTDTTRADLTRIMTDKLIEGSDIDGLGEGIKELFDATYAGRHLTIARTESSVAYAHASTAAFKTSGLVAEVMVRDNPNHTEEYAGAADGLTCANRNKLVVALDRGTFHVESDHPNGSACVIPFLSKPLGEV